MNDHEGVLHIDRKGDRIGIYRRGFGYVAFLGLSSVNPNWNVEQEKNAQVIFAALSPSVGEKTRDALVAAKQLEEWIGEKLSRAVYEFDELGMTPKTSPAWKELEEAKYNGFLASFREQFAEVQPKSDGAGNE